MTRLAALSLLLLPLFLLVCTLPAQPPPPVWGFADLHTHPATNFGFGADSTGHNGLVWGIPMSLTGADSIAADLPPCDPLTHDPLLSLTTLGGIPTSSVLIETLCHVSTQKTLKSRFC